MINFTYEDWIPETDGDGYSLVIRDERGPLASWNDEAAWRASVEIHGSPGREDRLREGLQLPGDVNQDGRFNISDPIGILRHLFAGEMLAICATPAANLRVIDINGDKSGNLTDAVHALNYLFREGAAPALGIDCVEIAGCATACR
jgi:hypothetical protein